MLDIHDMLPIRLHGHQGTIRIRYISGVSTHLRYIDEYSWCTHREHVHTRNGRPAPFDVYREGVYMVCTWCGTVCTQYGHIQGMYIPGIIGQDPLTM